MLQPDRTRVGEETAVPHQTCFTWISIDTTTVVQIHKGTCGHLIREYATRFQTDGGVQYSLADAQWKATYHWLVRDAFDWHAGSTPTGLNMTKSIMCRATK